MWICITPEAITRLFAFELSKFKFSQSTYVMDFLKGANKMYNKWGRGVVGATPEGMDHHIFVKCKNDT